MICATWPSTQTQPSLAIQALIFWLTTRTGHGSSAVLFGTPFGSGVVTAPPYGPTPGGGGAHWRRRRGGAATYDWRVIEEPARKRVLLAKPRGYCAGVDRAVQTVEEALKLYGAPIYVRKQIVHNKHVVATLEAAGAIFVEENDEVPEGATWSSPPTASRPRCYEQAKARATSRRSTRPARW